MILFTATTIVLMGFSVVGVASPWRINPKAKSSTKEDDSIGIIGFNSDRVLVVKAWLDNNNNYRMEIVYFTE